MKKQLKIAALAALLALGGFSANAQQVTAGTDIGKQTNTGLDKKDTYVEVIDRKGTRKFLQAKNGLTTWTDKTPSGGEVTTWQLGGELTENTYIDTKGKVFAIKGIKALDAVANPVSDIAATSTTVGTSGFTLMVRDEATGETKKMLAEDLLKVKGYHNEVTAPAASPSATTIDIPLTAFKAAGVTKFQVSVYRNGAKLSANTDYTFVDGKVVVAGTFPIYEGDVFEAHVIK